MNSPQDVSQRPVSHSDKEESFCSRHFPWVSFLGRRDEVVLGMLLALLTFVVYLPALRNGFVGWDDGLFVYENHHIFRLDAEFFLWAITDTSIDYWRPLSWISHALDYAWWGLNPVGHHLTNIILHAINTFLVVILACEIIRFWNRVAHDPSDTPVAFSYKRVLVTAGVTGALFGFHPIHVESVAWVAERKDLLYGLFYLMGLISYTGYVSSLPEMSTVANIFKNRRYYLTYLFFLLSLCSKPMAITLPFVLLMLDWYPFGRCTKCAGIKVLIIEKVPFLVVSSIAAASTIIAQKKVGAIVDSTDLSAYERVLMSFHSLTMYLWKTIVPLNLLPLYPYPKDISLANMQFPAAIFCVAAISFVCLFMIRKTRVWLAAWGYFIVTVFPVLGLVQSGPQPMADRYMYLPVLAPFMMIGLGFARGEEKYAGKLKVKWLLRLTAVSALALLCFLTVKQTVVWRDNISLWNYVIEKEPGRLAIAYHNRGIALMAISNYDQAIEDSSKAINLNPEFPDSYHNRGNAFAGKGENSKAIVDFKRAIALKPGDAALYSSIGLAYAAMGEFNAAIESYSRALSLKPDYGEVFNNRGLAFAGKGDFPRAFADFDRAGQLKPGDASVHVNRGIVLAAQGRNEFAEKEYAAALMLNPAPALAATVHSNRGILLFNWREFDHALEDFNAAVALNPDSVPAHNNRGALYLALGEYARAAEDFSTVLTLNPGLVKAHLDRGEAYRRVGKNDLARDDFNAACKMGSDAGCRNVRSLP